VTGTEVDHGAASAVVKQVPRKNRREFEPDKDSSPPVSTRFEFLYVSLPKLRRKRFTQELHADSDVASSHYRSFEVARLP
jgi:hypothetical protein